MIFDEHAARTKIGALLALPAILAGAPSSVLALAADMVGNLRCLYREFGPLVPDAQTARDTVHSALLAMRDEAGKREQERS